MRLRPDRLPFTLLHNLYRWAWQQGWTLADRKMSA
jgi:hypothetical protein